jgi:hypothetical protein
VSEEMTDDEFREALRQLIVAQGLYREVGRYVSTKSADNLRGEVNREALRRYRETGESRWRVTDEAGSHLGDLSISFTKPAAERVTQRLMVVDPRALEESLRHDEAALDDMVGTYAEEYAERVFDADGVIPDGCEVREERVPASPSEPKAVTARVDGDGVAATLGLPPRDAVRGLLGSVGTVGVA